MKFFTCKSEYEREEIIPLFGAGVAEWLCNTPIIIDYKVKSVQYKSYKFNLH